jgi:hypothetical protein
MGKQLLGAFLMFIAIEVVAIFQFPDVDTREAELWRRGLFYLIRGVVSLALFGLFFVGLKVFAVGLAQEWAGLTGRPPADPGRPAPNAAGPAGQ